MIIILSVFGEDFVEEVPSWIERLLLPRLSEISGEIKALNARINGLEKVIESLRNEMLSKFDAVNFRIDSLEKTISSRFEAVNTRIDSLEKKNTSN